MSTTPRSPHADRADADRASSRTVSTAAAAPSYAAIETATRQRSGEAPSALRRSICELFQESVARHGDQAALLHKEGGAYRARTYRELAEQVRSLALGLERLGVTTGERVALLAANAPEWAITDLATLSLGAVTVPLYTTLPGAQVKYILADSGACVILVDDEKQWRKVAAVRESLPELRHIIMIAPRPAEAAGEGVLAFADVLESGRATGLPEAEWERRWRAVSSEDLASIIYTSGTTGDPKGAMLTHGNFASNAQAAAQLIEIGPGDTFLSFLPLSHVFERLGGHFLPLSRGASIAYAESLFTVQQNMLEVRPTIMMSVPRLYESMQSRILDTVAKASPLRQRLFHWGLRVGRAAVDREQAGQSIGLLLALQRTLADRLVAAKVRARTGGRIRYFVSGGAPLPRATAEFFAALGLTILEGYGLTETSPVITVNRPGQIRFGTVGPPIPGVEVKIAGDGEILTRGPHVMAGYFNKPEATAEAIDPDGWFHTGDIGEFDAHGSLRITDRKKDILVLANGKNVAPQPIEAALKASPYIAEIVLLGDRQATVTALVVPAFDRLRAFARDRGLPEEPAALTKEAEVRRLLKTEIDRHSTHLADFERVKRFTVLDREFSIDGGELTPTLKLKRRVIAEKYADAIAGLYRGGE
jgi:long-chain acyl-CoA synthetase